jgi:hypothetical protein
LKRASQRGKGSLGGPGGGEGSPDAAKEGEPTGPVLTVVRASEVVVVDDPSLLRLLPDKDVKGRDVLILVPPGYARCVHIMEAIL